MKCIFIVNVLSGRYKKKTTQKKIAELSHGFEETQTFFLDDNSAFPDISGYHRVVVFGGDGTLNAFLNIRKEENQELIYIPIGTLNETAKNTDEALRKTLFANEKGVAYVFACGIFTPLGYNTKIKRKKKLKFLAYILNVIKEYKVARIKASITLVPSSKENNIEKLPVFQYTESEYTLIMCLKSKSCFGFKFNRLYDEGDSFQFLAIKSPKHNGILGKAEIFSPLFRCFFIGFKKEYTSKSIVFKTVDSARISLYEKTAFCLDGEKAEFDNDVNVVVKNIENIKIIPISD